MKRLSYILFIIFLTVNATVSAGQKGYKGSMGIEPLQLEQKGDSLYVVIDFDITGVSVGFQRSISIIPVLVSPGGEMPLSEVMVKGRLNYLTSKRELALMSRSDRARYDSKAPYAILKGYGRHNAKKIRYTKVLPFESWMKNARLDIREDLCGCGNPPRMLELSELVTAVKLEKTVEPYTVTPHLAYVQPQAENVKHREMESEAFLDFVVNKVNIRPGYMNNPQELAKITCMMDSLREDPSISVQSISVIGYASPEGTLKGNRLLSEGRAKALVNYLVPRFDYPRGMYRVVYGGENWDGLRSMLDTVRFRYRDEVLDIVNNRNVNDEVRKSLLKQLHDCEPYRYMLKEYFPSLRKAICRISYEIKDFGTDEAREVFRTRPQNLSLNEMYLVAQSYEKGSPEFIDVLETAVRIFPGDKTANLNAATAALSQGDTVKAERYLVKANDASAVYYNTMGVLMLLKDNYRDAEACLQKAAEKGLEAAVGNLAELQKKQENILQINK